MHMPISACSTGRCKAVYSLKFKTIHRSDLSIRVDPVQLRLKFVIFTIFTRDRRRGWLLHRCLREGIQLRLGPFLCVEQADPLVDVPLFASRLLESLAHVAPEGGTGQSREIILRAPVLVGSVERVGSHACMRGNQAPLLDEEGQ